MSPGETDRDVNRKSPAPRTENGVDTNPDPSLGCKLARLIIRHLFPFTPDPLVHAGAPPSPHGRDIAHHIKIRDRVMVCTAQFARREMPALEVGVQEPRIPRLQIAGNGTVQSEAVAIGQCGSHLSGKVEFHGSGRSPNRIEIRAQTEADLGRVVGMEVHPGASIGSEVRACQSGRIRCYTAGTPATASAGEHTAVQTQRGTGRRVRIRDGAHSLELQQP